MVSASNSWVRRRPEQGNAAPHAAGTSRHPTLRKLSCQGRALKCRQAKPGQPFYTKRQGPPWPRRTSAARLDVVAKLGPIHVPPVVVDVPDDGAVLVHPRLARLVRARPQHLLRVIRAWLRLARPTGASENLAGSMPAPSWCCACRLTAGRLTSRRAACTPCAGRLLALPQQAVATKSHPLMRDPSPPPRSPAPRSPCRRCRLGTRSTQRRSYTPPCRCSRWGRACSHVVPASMARAASTWGSKREAGEHAWGLAPRE